MTSERNILVLDDDPTMGSLVAYVAHRLGQRCTSVTNQDDFFLRLGPQTELIFLDVMMPDFDGIQVLRLLAEQDCKTNIVLMSGMSNQLMEATAVLGKTLGLSLVGSLPKPFPLSVLETVLTTFVGTPKPRDCSPVGAAHLTDNELNTAICENQFLLHFQPQIDLGTGYVAGFEALVRWQHPREGLLFPDSFIPRLEDLGLMNSLGLIVAQLSIPMLNRLRRAYGSSMTLSLNVSASSLLDLQFPETLTALARANNVPPDRIIVEVTETALLKDLSKSLDVLIRLRINGFQLSIDDFGTGYAMMEQLRYIPATEIKIDRSFVQNMNSRSSDRVVVEKTIEIGHDLGMKVVAEGVEQHSQLRFLKSIHCDLAQGYLFSRPLDSANLTAWMAALDDNPPCPTKIFEDQLASSKSEEPIRCL